MKKFNLFFLTFFMLGKIKYAPGTIASFFTTFLFFFLINFFNITLIFLLTLLIFFYSIIAINNSFKEFDSNDPQEIVIDEVVGQLLPLVAIPIYETLWPIQKIYYCIGAFLIFRLFDILKPFPINYIDKNVKGSLGIMLDDIIAGIATIVTLIILFFFLGG